MFGQMRSYFQSQSATVLYLSKSSGEGLTSICLKKGVICMSGKGDVPEILPTENNIYLLLFKWK